MAKNQKARIDRQFPHVECDTPPSLMTSLKMSSHSLGTIIRPRRRDCCRAIVAVLANGRSPFDINFVSHPEIAAGDTKWCLSWIYSEAQVRGLTFVSIFMIIVVNQVLNVVLAKLVRLEKKWFESDYLASMTVKAFLLKFLNTGLITLVVNSNLQYAGVQKIEVGAFPIFSGDHDDFNSSWYFSVGASLCLTMIFDILSAIGMPIGKKLLMELKLCKDRGCKSSPDRSKQETQFAFENLHLGPEFRLSFQYASLLNVVFTTLMFSSGMPLMILIGFASFFLRFLVDRWAFARLYRTPPPYNSIAKQARSVLPFASILHLIIGMDVLKQAHIWIQFIKSAQ